MSFHKQVLIDAFSFTLHGDNPYDDVFWLFGQEPSGWETLPYSRLGYKTVQKWGDILRWPGLFGQLGAVFK